MDINGDALWAHNGVTITQDGFSSQFISPDGQGGVIVAWGSENACVQKVSADGDLLWGTDGIRVTP